jgi:hypothetical protein
MKKQQIIQDYQEEINFLGKELDPSEMFVLGFLKGFDRKKLREWVELGLWDTSIELYDLGYWK